MDLNQSVALLKVLQESFEKVELYESHSNKPSAAQVSAFITGLANRYNIGSQVDIGLIHPEGVTFKSKNELREFKPMAFPDVETWLERP